MNRARLFLGSLSIFLLGCMLWAALGSRSSGLPQGDVRQLPVSSVHPAAFIPPTPLQLILAPQPGQDGTGLDKQIAYWQAELRKPDRPPAARLAFLEKLGWLFVAEGHANSDEGSYKLAEQCTLEMDKEQPGSAEAMLLRGHVLDQFHRFKEVEVLARKLVATRALAYDYGLLGDALMEQGQLDEAIGAYQKMLDLKPGFESFIRAAHMRWLKGDLAGARQLMGEVLGMIHPRELDTLAWAKTRVALYDLQAGNLPAAELDAETALQSKPTNAAAHLALGRILCAEGKEDEALDQFRAAAKDCSLPDYLWQLADHLKARGLAAEAAPIEQALRQTGRRADPRTLALYLATTGQDPAAALQLSEAELANRQDVLTWDALAWSQLASGQIIAAKETMKHALAEGTQDGRLFLHAAVIAAAAGDENEKTEYARKADDLKQMLFPSERRLLDGLAAPDQRHAAR